MLTIEKIRKAEAFFDEQSELTHKCKLCGEEYLVLGDVPDGGFIICDECSLFRKR